MPKKWKFLTENERAARARELKLKKSYERIKAAPLVSPIAVDFDADADAALPYVPDTLPAGKLVKVPPPTLGLTTSTTNDVRSSKKRTRDDRAGDDDAQTTTTMTKQQQKQQQQQPQQQQKQKQHQQRHQPEQPPSLERKHKSTTSSIVVEKNSNANDVDDVDDDSNNNNNDNDANDNNNNVANDEQDRHDDNEDSEEAAYLEFKKRRMSEMSGEVRKLSEVKNDRFLQARKAYASKQLEALDRRLRGEFNAMRRARRQRERKTKRALMSRRSSQGQPLMSSMLFNLLDKLQSEKNK